MRNDIDFESCWRELREDPRVDLEAPHSLEDALESAATKTVAMMIEQHGTLKGAVITIEMLSELVVSGSKMFVHNWFNEMSKQGTLGLFDIVLQVAHVPPGDILAFLGALPDPTLERLTDLDKGGPAHVLLLAEHQRRAGNITSYDLTETNGGLSITLHHPANGTLELALSKGTLP